jgi:hypothetical protein
MVSLRCHGSQGRDLPSAATRKLWLQPQRHLRAFPDGRLKETGSIRHFTAAGIQAELLAGDFKAGTQ